MVKSNKGITLVMLAITVVILAILAGVAINVGYSTYRNAEVTGYVTTMNMIQSRVNLINKKIAEGDTSYTTLGIELSELDTKTQEKINVALDGQAKPGFKYYNKKQLESIGISQIEEEVIINFETREIYSLTPIVYENVKYYNQYNLPNGIKLTEYSGLTTVAPEFTLEKDNYGLTTTINVTNIIYDDKINGSNIYYGEVIDNTTEEIVVDYWKKVEGTSFSVTKTAKYAVKVVDKNCGEKIKTVDVVTCNSPELTSGMIPVIYEDGVWKKVSNNEIGKWYDYAEGKWANIMLNDGVEINSNGTIATMGSMFVWIPRYAYKINGNYHNGGDGVKGEIEIRFLKDLTYVTTEENTTKMSNSSGENNWNVHPAFIDGSENNYSSGGWNKELTGFWVAKFEASSSSPELDYGGGNVTTLNVKVLPNIESWRGISLENIFSNCLSMNNTGNIYGLPTNAITHLTKNSEWGAIAYLAHSKYGRNGTEIITNNSGAYITGNAANSVGDSKILTGIVNAYDSEKGVLASTTGNIYGVYDMAGGSAEFVSAGLTTKVDAILKNITGFSEKLVDRYQEVNNSSNGKENYELAVNKYGDAIYETSSGETSTKSSESSWLKDSSIMPFANSGFILRSDGNNKTTDAGIFSFNKSSNTGASYNGFRPTIVIE